jgi:hypothetical protein
MNVTDRIRSHSIERPVVNGKVKIFFGEQRRCICRSQTLLRNKSPSNEDSSLKYASSVEEEIQYQHSNAENVEEVSLD